MAKTRLTAYFRNELLKFFKENYKDEKILKQLDKLYNKVKPEIDKTINLKYPDYDMEVLKRYDVGRHDRCIKVINVTNGYNTTFWYRKDDAPYLPDRYCSSRNFKVTIKTFNLIEEYENLRIQYNELKGQSFKDCDQALHCTRYAEDILKWWPAVKKKIDIYIEQKKRQLPVDINPEKIENLKKLNVGG